MYDRNLSEDEKIKEKIMRTLKIKICKTDIEKQKKREYMKNYYYYRRKNLLNCLIKKLKNLKTFALIVF